ncbi:MAG TPA: YCF48-related protein [Ignavibacteria bacterium]|nr:YCF48-related protein [Ignavibacteria bacterium]
MKKIKHSFTIIFFLFAAISFSQEIWQSQYSGVTSKLYDIYFLNSNIGFIVGDSSVILKTTNAGADWNRISVGTDHPFRSIYFPNQNTGYIGGGKANVVIGFLITNRILLKTTDQGLNWSIVYSDGNYPSQDVYFLNSETGWSSGNGLIKTTNGGLNWLNFGGTATKIYFKNENEGSYWGNYGGPGIWKTINGGFNWFTVGEYYAEGGITFPSDLIGYATGTNGIAKTTDGGNNWFSILDWDGNWRVSNYFINNNNGYTVGYAAGFNEPSFIQKTTNGGISWSMDDISSAPLYSVFMVNDSNVWVAGAAGQILKKSTTVDIHTIQSESLSEFRLSQNFPNPFNPSTNLEFGISDWGFVSLKVYDALGKAVRTIVSEYKPAGNYNIEFDGSDLTSGIYFYRLEAGKYSATKRMILLK